MVRSWLEREGPVVAVFILLVVGQIVDAHGQVKGVRTFEEGIEAQRVIPTPVP